MAGLSLDHPLPFAFGILGNILSFMVYLAPIPTFYRIYRMRSTEGFQSLPYMVALFSAMLWIYYALLKTDEFLLITINSFGCFIETTYIFLFLVYAPRTTRIFTVQIFFLLNVVSLCSIVLLTQLLSDGPNRVHILGWICVGFSVSVFVAPLSIIRLVLRTRSVEYMPFSLSAFLTLSAIAWLLYGLFARNLYVVLPNILGIGFGLTQMLLYVIIICKRNSSAVNPTVPEHVIAIVRVDPAPDFVDDLGIECREENGCLEDKANREAIADDRRRVAAEDPEETDRALI